MKKQDKRNKSIMFDPLGFVEVWQTSETLQEAADKLGMTTKTASLKASRFRKKGVPLKNFRTASVDWAAVTKYAESFKGGE